MECSLNNIIRKKKYFNCKNNSNSTENLLFNRMLSLLCHQQNGFDNLYDNITDMVTKHI